MDNLWALLGLVAAWLVLVKVVFPQLGIRG